MLPPNALLAVGLIFAIALGAVVGSFLNVCIYRLPWEKSLIWPGSHCPHCSRPVRAYDNIPILSWLILRGRCRHCGARFSARYMFIELLTAGLFGLLFWLLQPADRSGLARYGCYIFLLGALIVATFIDLDLQIIPDSVTVPGMLVGLIGSTWWPQVSLVPVTDLAPGGPLSDGSRWLYMAVVIGGWLFWCTGLQWLWRRRADRLGTAEGLILAVAAIYLAAQSFSVLAEWGAIPPNWLGWPIWFNQHPHWRGFFTAVVGMLVGAGMIEVVRVLGSAAMGREAMGFGDVTLMAVVGSFLGWQGALFVFFVAPFMGLGVGLVQWTMRGENVLPYGPYLSLGAAVTLLGWGRIWPAVEPRLAILGSFGFAWWGWVIVLLLPVLAVCLRIFVQAMEASERAEDVRADGAGTGDRPVEGNR